MESDLINILTITTAFATIATAFATWYLYFVARDNLTELNKTSDNDNLINNAKFLSQFNAEFFSTKTRLIFELIEYDIDKETDDDLAFILNRNDNNEDEEWYFNIKIDNIKDELVKQNYNNSLTAAFGYEKKIFTTTEIDDLLLGHFELIGIYKDKGILDNIMIYETFSYYIQTCHENKQIEKYIEYIRKEDDILKKPNNPYYESDIYKKFDEIYKLCNEQEKLKMKRRK